MSVPTVARITDAALEATVALSFSRVGYEVRSRIEHWTPTSTLDGSGKVAVVTGANSGLGYATATGLLRSGARVITVVRSDEKGEDTVDRLRKDVSGAEVRYEVADLTELATVRELADRLRGDEPHLDVLVHNAGAMFPERDLTIDGLERTYQLHVVGPHLLTSLLTEPLLVDGPARVITMTSGGMYTQRLDLDRLESPDDYRPATAYARAKRAQVVLTGQWARRFGSRGMEAHVTHPGWALTPGVETSMPRFRRLTGPVLRDPEQGADTAIWLALTPDVGPPGRLWHDRRRRSAHKSRRTRETTRDAARLWDRVQRDAGLTDDG